MYYAKDRYYDAGAGRFIRKDRCENDRSAQDSLNRYVYVGNNPKKYTDPSGKFAIPLYAAVGLVLLVYGTVYIISVNAGYLRTKEGKKLLPYTDEIIYGQSTYSVDDFLSRLSSVGRAAKELYQSAKKEVKKFWKLVKSLGKSNGKAKGKGKAEEKGKDGKEKANREDRTVDDIISEEKKGSIRARFPKEWLDSTQSEIEKAAKRGDKSAQTAKKLLNDKDFNKGSNSGRSKKGK